MSSSSRQHQNNRASKKGVRFAQQQEQQQQEDDPEPHSRPFKKRKKNDAWNGDDDEDDVDKWNNKTEDDEEYQKVLEAKRKRRLQQKRRNTDEDDDDEFDNDPTVIDQQTSLGADEGEIAIEPFHMKQEESDGLGYFDGDTYVFRRAKEEEPDAWLDMLDEQKEQPDSQKFAARKNANSSPSSSSEPSEDAVPPSRSELIGNMIPFVSDTETVIQALVRYGNLLQSMRKQQKQSKQQAASSGTSNSADDAATASTMEMAQSSLNTLTEASNELMLQHGMVDIYQQTRQDLLQMLSADEAQDQAFGDNGKTTNATVTQDSQQQPQQKADNPTVVVQWEYMGNEDGQVHGPFSTADMLAWTGAGYFIGEQAVQVRSITTTTASSTNNHATLQEDLLADLMDDDDDDNNGQSEAAVNGSKVAPVVVLGEWTSSNQVDFAAHA